MVSKLTLQKRLAADILKVGKSRVWLDPDPAKQKEIQAAITRADINRLIKRKVIKVTRTNVKRPRSTGANLTRCMTLSSTISPQGSFRSFTKRSYLYTWSVVKKKLLHSI